MIAKKTFRETLGVQVAYLLILEAMIFGAILWWGDLRDVLAEISKLGFLGVLGKLIPFDFLKKPFLALVDPERRYTSYIALQHFFKGINIMGIAAALLLGTFVIAKERENGTLELLLSLPISRTRILLEKTLVIAAGLVAGVFISSVSMIPMSTVAGEQLPFLPVILCSVHASIIVLFFFSLTILASTFFKTQASVAFAVGIIIAIEFAQYFIQVARNWSFFKLSDFDVYYPILSGNTGLPVWPHETLVAGAALLMYGFAHKRFLELEP